MTNQTRPRTPQSASGNVTGTESDTFSGSNAVKPETPVNEDPIQHDMQVPSAARVAPTPAAPSALDMDEITEDNTVSGVVIDPDSYTEDEIANMSEEDIPSGYMKKHVLDDGEYVLRLVPYAPKPAFVLDLNYRDGLELPAKVTEEGKWAGFDFRWEAPTENVAGADMSHDHGFRPVKARNNEFKDTNYETRSNGEIHKGGLQLFARPKEVTEERALAQFLKNSKLLGEEIENYEDQRVDGMALNPDYGNFFVDKDHTHLDHGGGSLSKEDLQRQNQLSVADQIDKGSRESRGLKTFAINAPWQVDKVSQRHRPAAASVGGHDRYAEALGSVGGR